MRIAVFVNRFPSVSETFVVRQITGLLDSGHDVEIFARGAGTGAVHSEIERYSLLERTRYSGVPRSWARRLARILLMFRPGAGVPPGWLLRALGEYRRTRSDASLQLLFDLRAVGKRGEYDVILCHFGQNALRALALQDFGAMRGRLVSVFHGYDITSTVNESGPDLYAELFARGDLFLPVSERWKEKLTAMGCPPDRIQVHRMGVDLSRFGSRRSAPDSKRPARVLTVARLVEKKGVEYGIRAVAVLVASGLDVEYTIVGDGPLRDPLQQLARELGVEPSVRFAGWQRQDQIIGLMQGAQLFIAPSVTAANGDQEGIPVALMEAMASGLPVVSTEHSGIPELIEDGVSGYLVPECDVEALAERVRTLVESPELRGKMATAGRRRVEAEFNTESLNRALVAILERVAQGPQIGKNSPRVRQ